MSEDVEMTDAEADEAEVADELAASKRGLYLFVPALTSVGEETDETDSGDESDQQPTKWNSKKKNKNSGLAVGHKGIAVVLRGDQLGIFKETTDGKLELGGTVNEIKAPGSGGKSFNPNKAWRIMVFQALNTDISPGYASRPRSYACNDEPEQSTLAVPNGP